MHAAPLIPGQGLPMVPEMPRLNSARDAVVWARSQAAEIRRLASTAGAVLLRGLGIATPGEFRAACAAIEPELRTYTGGDSPRTGVADRVYTSTEYAEELEVLLHNGLSYAGWSPRLVFFGCLQPPLAGGETQIADGRAIYRAMPEGIRAAFETRGIVYLQHLWDADDRAGIGKSWQETFETADRAAVESYLEASGMDWEWTEFGLRTRAPHAAVIAHPLTGEACWWNQADQWHRGLASVKTSFGDEHDPRFDPATAGEESLGNHVVYGDGGEIGVADLETIRAVNRSRENLFAWRAGDVMVLDNILAMHGRKPYRGPRRVLVAIA